MQGISLPGFSIRAYRAEDRDALLRLWDTCALSTSYNDPDQDIALALRTDTAALFVGDLEGRVCASVLVGHDGHRGWLYYLASEPELQGRGLGGALVRHCEAWLVEREVPKIQLMIRPNNLGAKAFYRKLGYEPNPCHVMQRWILDRGAPPAIPGSRPDGLLAYAITYLEMTQRPKRPVVPAPRNRKVALLRAEAPTVAFYRFLYNTIGEPWLWWYRRTMSDADLAALIGDEGIEIFVLYVGGVPAGYAELDRREAPDVDLAYFGLMPDFVGQGLGPYLLSSVLDIAWNHEPRKVTVNTCSLDHPKALPLYQRHGFEAIQREEVVIEDPRVSGILPPTAGA